MQAPGMLAYVFWHRPFAHVDRKAYEAALARFLADLPRNKPPGLIAAGSFRIEPVPWLSAMAGYEDWYLLEGSWALDPLNAFAITGSTQAPHDNVAALMEEGRGGLYAHAGGEPTPAAQSAVLWLTRPRGIAWRAALDPVRVKEPQVNIWRRQMVLGPAWEFAVEARSGADIEPLTGWQGLRVNRVKVA
jgi:hypothetical protein